MSLPDFVIGTHIISPLPGSLGAGIIALLLQGGGNLQGWDPGKLRRGCWMTVCAVIHQTHLAGTSVSVYIPTAQSLASVQKYLARPMKTLFILF